MPRKLKKAKTKSGGKKKSGKKKGARKATKTKLQISIEKYRKDPEKYRELMRNADTWFTRNREELTSLLQLHVSYSPDHVTYDDFKAALITMNIPMNKLEIHIITLLFDFDQDGFIHLDDLSTSLMQLRIKEEFEENAASLKTFKPVEDWVSCQLCCLSLLELQEHPFHFTRLFPSTTYTEELVSVIKSQTGLCSPEVSIYLKPQPETDQQLQPNLTLLDHGIHGSEEYSPQHITLYYCTADYRPESWAVTEAPKLLSPVRDSVLWSDVKWELEDYEKRLEQKFSVTKPEHERVDLKSLAV